jgi:MoaA/NifB/PqqE/SkfB family radical SAM enzyme
MINVQRIEPVISNRKYVTWVLNNICPYSCVYCPEIVHSGKIKTYYDWEVHKEFLDFLFDYWKGNKITFAITGGEPTVHPYFEKILDKINEAGHDVGITTNLSRSINFWESIIDKLNYVSTSFHPHYENTDIKHKKFIDKLLVLSEKTKYEVRVMMYPELWDTCIDFIDKVRETNYNWTDGAIDQVMTVKVLEDFGILDKYCDINYTDEQLDYIDNFDFASEDIIINHKIQERNKQLYSVQEQVYLIDIENKKYIPNHIQEISNKRLTNFSGWNCNIGIDSIYIDYDGVIKGGNCLEGGIIGDLLSKVNWNVEPIRCGSTYCHCVTDIKITKEFVEDANEVLLPKEYFSTYDGEYTDGLRHGIGTHYYTSGDKYFGEWEYGVQTGKGVFTYADGSIHSGYYKGGVYNGSGRFTHPDGTKYKGNFLEGEFHDTGVLILPNGEKYDGIWENGIKCGYGKLIMKDGVEYIGEFKNNLQHGNGKVIELDGTVYDGIWKDGDKEKGKLTTSDGHEYIGEFKNSLQHGNGKIILPDGTILDGIWKNGRMNGLGKLFLSNGIVYEGEFRDGLENGKGKSVLPNGETYIGEWKNGKKHGKGFIKYVSGAQYEGDWVDSLQHGYGILITENKTKIYGRFRRGDLIKEIGENVYNKKK